MTYTAIVLGWRRWIPLAPFGGLVAVHVLYRRLYALTGVGAVELEVPATGWRALPGPEAAVADMGARLTWGFAALAFVVAFVAALVVCLHVIWRASAGTTRITLMGLSLLGGAAGIVTGLAGNPLTLPKVADDLIAGFTKMGIADGAFLLHLFNGLAMASAALLTFAAASTLVLARGRETDAPMLQRQARRLRHVLYAGAAVLIAGSTTTATMHRLPIAYLNEPWSRAFETFSQVSAIAAGTLWSFFLVAIYLPSALILRSRFAHLAQAALPRANDRERRQWITDHGLDLSPAQQLKRLVAVLGPVLSSLPLAGLFELLSSA